MSKWYLDNDGMNGCLTTAIILTIAAVILIGIGTGVLYGAGIACVGIGVGFIAIVAAIGYLMYTNDRRKNDE